MSPKLKIVLFFFLLFSYQLSFSQIDNHEKDSTEIYKNLQSYSKKNKFTQLVYGFIFKPTKSTAKAIIPKQKKHLKADGKIIRNITIVTLDPFGYSDSDTAIHPKKWSERTGNRLHLKSKEFAIRNLLLFKKNNNYNLFLIKETERIIRTQRFVNSVTITEKFSSKKKDSVDIFIRVLDSWSTVPKLEISSSRLSIGLFENNFFGTGQQFDYLFTNRFSDGKNANNFTYTIPNIKNTFINSKVKYQTDLDNYYTKSITVGRPFYSPLTKWAAGILLEQQFRKDTIQGTDLIYKNQNLKYSVHDFWIGKAFNIFKGNSINERTTNLILAADFVNKNYIERPAIEDDPIDFYSNEKSILIGIGINTRQFIEDRYIFKNGIIEDVPIGRIYGVTAGYQYKNQTWRPYLGAQISFGNYHQWGFLSTNVEIGTYFNQSKTEQTSLSFQANYFTNLFELGNWKLRQFIKPQVIIGLNRKNSIGDQLSINEDNGIQGFNSAVYGNHKMVMTLQTQSYAPRDIWGFRTSPYFNYTFALIGNSDNNNQKNKGYSKIGIGVIISNDYLVFSSFQLSLSYYPTIPFQGDSVFRTNAFQTSDFGLQSFELAKPRTVLFK